MPFYDTEGYEIEVTVNIYDWLIDEGMDEDDALSFAEDYQTHLDDARNGEISWDDFHDYELDFSDVLEEEYGIDYEDYGETT